jgi:hypothetical protein
MAKIPVVHDELLSIEISSVPYINCPKCVEGIAIRPSNFMEHISQPHLFLLYCRNCDTNYQLKLQEITL